MKWALAILAVVLLVIHPASLAILAVLFRPDVALVAGGAALGALIFRPRVRRG